MRPESEADRALAAYGAVLLNRSTSSRARFLAEHIGPPEPRNRKPPERFKPGTRLIPPDRNPPRKRWTDI